jgi:polyribonucleotide nucleotidyltransferase
VEDIVKLGDKIEVKLMRIDEEGRLNLSRKALLPGGEKAHEEIHRARERRERHPHDKHRTPHKRH